MTDSNYTAAPGADEVLFVPLGGVGEIGMNVALYGHAGAWLMVDLGITFADETTPGVEVILPDLVFAEARRRELAGLVLTHGHEDHLGAVPYLWQRLGCPVYGTRFTLALLKRKLSEVGLLGQVPLVEVVPGTPFAAGPFRLELLHAAHSIPEPNSLALRTPVGTLLHTGDWKLDPEPVVGRPLDGPAYRRLGDAGVLAMFCDSTNAMVEGHSGSEAALAEPIEAQIRSAPHRVLVACFASNVARLRTVSLAAARCGRRTALVGRSLHRMADIARETGYFDGVPEFVAEEHVGYLPRSEIAVICTGSQGEPRAALTRIAANAHPHLVVDAGDRLIYSSRMIPGNERAIGRVQNDLLRQGIDIVTADDAFVHVSGHPAREELRTLYGWVRPRIAVPVHGELRHMQAHAGLAREMGAEPIVIEDGAVLRVSAEGARVVGRAPTGRLALDGRRIGRMDGAVRVRRQMEFNGSAVATLVLGRGRRAHDVQLSFQGVVDEADAGALRDSVRAALVKAVDALDPAAIRNDDAVREAARIAVRRAVRNVSGKRPVTDIHVVRVE